jgi:hypothetical protein
MRAAAAAADRPTPLDDVLLTRDGGRRPGRDLHQRVVTAWVCGQLASVSPHTYGWLTTAFQLMPACGVTGSCAMLE